MPRFIMMCGLPGSGKSYNAKEYTKQVPDAVIVSSDDIRQELWGDANDQQNPKRVFESMMIRSVAYLAMGRDVIYDATNLCAKTRKNTLKSIRKASKNVTAFLVFVACSISECKKRQSMRARQVPDEVIDRMVRQFEAPWYNEGWDHIVVLTGGKLQDIDREHKRMTGESHDNPHHTASLEMHCTYAEKNISDFLFDNEWEYDAMRKQILIEAAYQHDLGKHKTKAFHDTKGNPTDIAHYYNHNNVGAYLWLSGDKVCGWSTSEFLYIGLLIQWHTQPFFMRDKEGDYRIQFKEWCDKRGFNDFFYEDICLIHRADLAAH